jgi:hypothetical protein
VKFTTFPVKRSVTRVRVILNCVDLAEIDEENEGCRIKVGLT